MHKALADVDKSFKRVDKSSAALKKTIVTLKKSFRSSLIRRVGQRCAAN